MKREELKFARHRAGMRQVDLANASGVSRKVISDIERGIGNPSMNTWETIVATVRNALDNREAGK